jgi:methyltransferase (TIGR00027 family)
MSESPEISHPSRTSIMVAAGRAIGAREPDASVRNPDFLAEQFLGPEIRALRVDHLAIQALDRDYDDAIKDLEVLSTVRMMMIRTRFIEERLEHAIRGGATQVVILGAGFDTRAYRPHRASERSKSVRSGSSGDSRKLRRSARWKFWGMFPLT